MLFVKLKIHNIECILTTLTAKVDAMEAIEATLPILPTIIETHAIYTNIDTLQRIFIRAENVAAQVRELLETLDSHRIANIEQPEHAHSDLNKRTRKVKIVAFDLQET
jgi:hypothetical protein